MAEKPTDVSVALRSWLMKAPRPHSVRIYARDGKEYDCEIKPGVAWSETAVSVTALEPERLEATSADGKLLRACKVADLVAREESVQAQAQSSFAAMQSTDPETQRLICFATLLERAHERSTSAIENTVAVAFTRMQEICDSLAQQANAAQASANDLTVGIRNLLIQQAQEAAEEARGEPSPIEQFASQFMAGKAAAAAEAGAEMPVAKPNGKH